MRELLLFVIFLPITCWAGEMTLDNTASDISFVSVKKGSVAEVHRFGRITGSIEGKSAFLAVDLATVESGIEVRNERMRSMLFETARFKYALIRADLSAVSYSKLATGEALSATVPLTLDLHGVKHALSSKVYVVKTANGGLLVSSRDPVIIRADDFELAGGIEALRLVAGLSSIAQAVPVSFHLLFNR